MGQYICWKMLLQYWAKICFAPVVNDGQKQNEKEPIIKNMNSENVLSQNSIGHP